MRFFFLRKWKFFKIKNLILWYFGFLQSTTRFLNQIKKHFFGNLQSFVSVYFFVSFLTSIKIKRFWFTLSRSNWLGTLDFMLLFIKLQICIYLFHLFIHPARIITALGISWKIEIRKYFQTIAFSIFNTSTFQMTFAMTIIITIPFKHSTYIRTVGWKLFILDRNTSSIL